MQNGKFKKLNISIPPDLHEWIKKKQADFKKQNPLGKLEISPFIAHCIKSMKESEEGKSRADAGANALKASENFVSTSSTATKKSFRLAG